MVEGRDPLGSRRPVQIGIRADEVETAADVVGRVPPDGLIGVLRVSACHPPAYETDRNPDSEAEGCRERDYDHLG